MEKKFDLAIMNPPYDKNLHLKILEKVIPECDEVINISPIRWLQDPLAKYKKNSDYNKFNDSIVKHISDFREISQTDVDNMFGIQFNANIGVIKCDKKGGYNIDSIKDSKYIEIYDKVIEKTAEIKHVSYKESSKNNFVPICLLSGHITVGESLGLSRDRYKYFINNKCQCERFLGQSPEECKSYNLKSFDTVQVVEFKTPEEAKNFYHYIKLKSFVYFVWKHSMDGNISTKFLPFAKDYSQPWTNKRFCDYFDITGFISDTEAEPNSEWEEILKTMEKYK